jgi:hypothetical protein
MNEHIGSRRLRIIVSDEETGEEVATATGVESLIMLAAPGGLRGENYRHILLGDAELSVQVLHDIVRDVTERVGRGTVVDLSDVLNDDLLLEITRGLPRH